MPRILCEDEEQGSATDLGEQGSRGAGDATFDSCFPVCHSWGGAMAENMLQTSARGILLARVHELWCHHPLRLGISPVHDNQ